MILERDLRTFEGLKCDLLDESFNLAQHPVDTDRKLIERVIAPAVGRRSRKSPATIRWILRLTSKSRF